MKRVTTIILIQVGILLAGSYNLWASQREESNHTIVPGVGVGDYRLGMSKDEVLKKLGRPEAIRFAGKTYTLNKLPRRYYLAFGDISFAMVDDAVVGISVHSPSYKFANGMGVGDSEEKIRKAFGNDYAYGDNGLHLQIDQKSGTVEEIGIYEARHGRRRREKIPSTVKAFDDVRWKDLRACDLRNVGDILDTLYFNRETRWPTPDRLPTGFDPNTLMEAGMNPGLGVRALHAEGITGKGVHVGLIDQPLVLDHPEYAGKIVSYHDVGCGRSGSSMHGPAMASLLVGERCGTAPGAKLHVAAVPSWKGDASYYAQALDWFVARNQRVPDDRKIRVVSVSASPSGEGSGFMNQSLWDQAVERAEAGGILVLDGTWHHGFVSLCWLDPQDRESVEACTPGFRDGIVEADEGHIHVPTAPRTKAEAYELKPLGFAPYGYLYDGGARRSPVPMSNAGYSPAIPYAAGILALGWQIRPDLTPAQMKELLFASAYVHESGARIINPRAFIELIRKQSGNQKAQAPLQTNSKTQD